MHWALQAEDPHGCLCHHSLSLESTSATTLVSSNIFSLQIQVEESDPVSCHLPSIQKLYELSALSRAGEIASDSTLPGRHHSEPEHPVTVTASFLRPSAFSVATMFTNCAHQEIKCIYTTLLSIRLNFHVLKAALFFFFSLSIYNAIALDTKYQCDCHLCSTTPGAFFQNSFHFYSHFF